MSNQNNLEPRRISPFEAIRRENEQGNEYWSARELGKILGYATNYRNFQKAIQKGEEACKNSGQAVSDHFAFVRNMIRVGKGAKREYSLHFLVKRKITRTRSKKSVFFPLDSPLTG